MNVVIDSSVLCAFANPDDALHQQSVDLLKTIMSGKYGTPIITDYIFDEVVTVVMVRVNKQQALLFGRYLLNSVMHLVKIDSYMFYLSWRIFQEDNHLSLTDSSLVALSQYFNTMHIATFDKEFKKIKGLHVVGC